MNQYLSQIMLMVFIALKTLVFYILQMKFIQKNTSQSVLWNSIDFNWPTKDPISEEIII